MLYNGGLRGWRPAVSLISHVDDGRLNPGGVADIHGQPDPDIVHVMQEHLYDSPGLLGCFKH